MRCKKPDSSIRTAHGFKILRFKLRVSPERIRKAQESLKRATEQRAVSAKSPEKQPHEEPVKTIKDPFCKSKKEIH